MKRSVLQVVRADGHERLTHLALLGRSGGTQAEQTTLTRATEFAGLDHDRPGMPDNPIADFVGPHLAAPGLRRVTLSGERPGATSPIRRAVIRPVEVRGRRALQVVTYDERRSTTTNVDDASATAIGEALTSPFRHVVVELAGEILEGRVTKKGSLVTSRKVVDERPLDLTHDRQKAHPIPEDAPFL